MVLSIAIVDCHIGIGFHGRQNIPAHMYAWLHSGGGGVHGSPLWSPRSTPAGALRHLHGHGLPRKNVWHKGAREKFVKFLKLKFWLISMLYLTTHAEAKTIRQSKGKKLNSFLPCTTAINYPVRINRARLCQICQPCTTWRQSAATDAKNSTTFCCRSISVISACLFH